MFWKKGAYFSKNLRIRFCFLDENHCCRNNEYVSIKGELALDTLWKAVYLVHECFSKTKVEKMPTFAFTLCVYTCPALNFSIPESFQV
jgi:hypothetical protein